MNIAVFTLPDTDIDTETEKKMDCTELCEGVHTAETQTQIPIGLYANLLVSVSVSVSASGSVNAPL